MIRNKLTVVLLWGLVCAMCLFCEQIADWMLSDANGLILGAIILGVFCAWVGYHAGKHERGKTWRT